MGSIAVLQYQENNWYIAVFDAYTSIFIDQPVADPVNETHTTANYAHMVISVTITISLFKTSNNELISPYILQNAINVKAYNYGTTP